MPVGPSVKMQNLAARWLVDLIGLQTQTVSGSTRANMASGDLTLGTETQVAALIRQPTVDDTDTPTANRAVRELLVWVDADATVTAGMRCNIVTCRDTTLEGDHGTVTTVERDSLRASRRITVELQNDA